MDATEFARVAEASNARLVKFVKMSRQLVDAYVEIAGIKNPTITDFKCADLANVSKVFSQSIRAFMEWEDLKYTSDDPVHSPALELKGFSKVETSSSNLLKYIAASQAAVDAYVKIIGIPDPEVTAITCTNAKEDVEKVFSHSSRAFLAWANSHLQYTEDEPENQ